MNYTSSMYIIGDSQTGKKTLIAHMVNDEQLVECKIQQSTISYFGRPEFVDSFEKVPNTAFAIVLVYNITNAKSFQSIQQISQQLQNKIVARPDFCPVRLIVGTHRDLQQNRAVSFQEALELKKDINGLFMETSVFQKNDTLMSQLSIRCVYCLQSVADSQQLPVIPLSVLQNGNIFDSQVLPKNYEQKLCLLVSDDQFQKSQTNKSQITPQINKQSNEHIQESHFFGLELNTLDKQGDNCFDNPYGAGTVQQQGILQQKSTIQDVEQILGENVEVDEKDLNNTFKLFIKTLGANVDEQEINDFLQILKQGNQLKGKYEKLQKYVHEQEQKINQLTDNNQLQRNTQSQQSLEPSRASNQFQRLLNNQQNEFQLPNQIAANQFQENIRASVVGSENPSRQSISRQKLGIDYAKIMKSKNNQIQPLIVENIHENSQTNSQLENEIDNVIFENFSHLDKKNATAQFISTEQSQIPKNSLLKMTVTSADKHDNDIADISSIMSTNDSKSQHRSTINSVYQQNNVNRGNQKNRSTQENQDFDENNVQIQHVSRFTPNFKKTLAISNGIQPENPSQPQFIRDEKSNALKVKVKLSDILRQKPQRQSVSVYFDNKEHIVRFNEGDNAYQVAEQFIEQYNIPKKYLKLIYVTVQKKIDQETKQIQRSNYETSKLQKHAQFPFQQFDLDKRNNQGQVLFKILLKAGAKKQYIGIKQEDFENVEKIAENFIKIQQVNKDKYFTELVSEIQKSISQYKASMI